jgi:hypothetical protein
MLPVSTRSRLAFSQVQPPCIAVLTITAGNDKAMRGSIPARIIVCVPPPLAPVTAMRLGSTSGRLARKSTERIEFHVCRPITLCKWASACGLKRPQFSVVFISGRCLANP